MEVNDLIGWLTSLEEKYPYAKKIYNKEKYIITSFNEFQRTYSRYRYSLFMDAFNQKIVKNSNSSIDELIAVYIQTISTMKADGSKGVYKHFLETFSQRTEEDMKSQQLYKEITFAKQQMT